MEKENLAALEQGMNKRAPLGKSVSSVKHSRKAPNPATLTDGVFSYLNSLPDFLDLPTRELRSLAESCRFALLEGGQCIATEGDDESPNGFIVVTGCLAISKSSSSGRTLIVELLQAGDVFGLMLMLSQEYSAAQLSARAIEPSTILWMPKIEYTRLIQGHPELLTRHVSHLLRCLQSSYRLARGLAHDKVEIRIAAILSSLHFKFGGSRSSDDAGTIHFTRQQLAELTGTTSETAIRVTRAMQRNGLIRMMHPGEITIVDLDSLNRLAEDW